jgi:hypothetical protein
MTNMPNHAARRRRSLVIAVATGAWLVPVVAAAASAESSRSIPPATTEATESTAGPEVPAGDPIVLAESTFAFGDGPYQWASTHGSVLDVDGEVTFDAGTVTFLAATSGTLLVPLDGSDPFELTAGAAIPRDEASATALFVPAGEPGGYVTIDIEATSAAPADAADATIAPETSTAGGDVAATPPSFAPGAGARTVTLHRVVVDPGTSFDAASIEHEFGYVVVIKGVLDTASGETLYTFDTLALPGDGVLTNASGSVAAEVLVATVTGPPPTAADV